MPLKLRFTTLDVFTTTPYCGNPLAIVHVPEAAASSLTQSQKQLIAREFNLSETVFLYEPSDNVFPINIFITNAELPFAGHPTVGTGWYIISRKVELSPILRTKAGDIPVTRDSTSGKARLRVPIDFKVHASYLHPAVKPLQARLTAEDYINRSTGAEAVVSIVKGMTFMLLHLSSEDALARMQPISQPVVMPDGYLGDWDGFVGVYAFYERDDGTIRTRMFHGAVEDPATGSAASALGAWLAQKQGRGERRFHVVQGVEMRRKSEIGVIVDISSDGEVKSVELEGEAVVVMEGQLEI
jgi:PhzF family phenazine biosynthesis protein